MLEIRIFILPTELNDLSRLFARFKRNVVKLSPTHRLRLGIIMGIGDEIVDWAASSLTSSECVDKFTSICSTVDWAELKFFASHTINGCVTARKEHLFDTEPDYYLWLDADIIFNDDSLSAIFGAIDLIEKHTDIKHFVLTPSTVRLWDDTWDCLVAPHFLDKPIGYQKTNNPYKDVDVTRLEEYTIAEVRNTKCDPYMKFAGGWFTVISRALLTTIPIPDSFTHYGLEDTYIMWVAHKLNRDDIRQFRIEELVVCENYFDRDTSLHDKIRIIDRREEYKQHNMQMFNIEYERIK